MRTDAHRPGYAADQDASLERLCREVGLTTTIRCALLTRAYAPHTNRCALQGVRKVRARSA